MQIGMLGLGRMGGNMAQRLVRGGHSLVLYDRDQSKVTGLAHDGAAGASSLEDFVKQLATPRVVWVMLPAGEITTQSIQTLSGLLAKGDIVIDGGNTHYVDDVAHSKLLAERGIEFVDSGTSGGIWGADRGYCLMIGGKQETVSYLDPIFRALAPGSGDVPHTPGRESRGGTAELGYIYCGPAGSGHFVKMVHNGIEYGLMQSFAEGFDLLSKASQFGYELPLADVAEVWRRGSVVSSWLLDLTAIALAKNEKLTEYTGIVADSGEGRWTVEAALQAAVPCNVLTTALYARFRSRQDHTFGEKLISAMRAGFGGHVEIGKEPKVPA